MIRVGSDLADGKSYQTRRGEWHAINSTGMTNPEQMIASSGVGLRKPSATIMIILPSDLSLRF
jgi:hypothetical protein